MIHYSNSGAEVCVIGRCNFNSGIGAITYAMCELLSRSFPVCILPTEPRIRGSALENITLPNGRSIPICRNTKRIKAFVFTDVLWNGAHDRNFLLVPEHGLRIATIVWDSNEFPLQWLEILAHRFDAAICFSPHLENVLRAQGASLPIATAPLALDVEALLAQSVPRPQGPFRFGSINAFHPRKDPEVLLEAFASSFRGNESVELVLHSNISFGQTLDRLRSRVETLALKNVRISTESLSHQKKNGLIGSFDVFANFSRGEGYSIGAREALALGKVLALSDVGGHKGMSALSGVFFAAADRTVPARYPEVDNCIFGTQKAVSVDSARKALEAAYEFARSNEAATTAINRRSFAADLSFGRLTNSYARLIDPDIGRFRAQRRECPAVHIPHEFEAQVRARVSSAGGLSHTRYRVIPAHDGGFFSVFNVFLSHLVWDLKDQRCHRVLPDWDVGRLIRHKGSDRLVSFCYGRPEDGNLWVRLFEPLFGLTEAEMNDESILYGHASLPTRTCNEDREPLLTYVHAYRLYRQSWFPEMRRQYNRVLRQHIHLRPALQAEINTFIARYFPGRYMIAAHVRHPSHVSEQPSKSIAEAEHYIIRIRHEIERRALRGSDSWGVFLATDQQRVIEQFEREFGDRVVFFADVRRTTGAEDSAFYVLPVDQRSRDGYQLQHLVASSPDNWSLRMAWEILRDAYVMAQCNLLLHVVSNVATGVAFINPNLPLEFIS